MPTFGLDSSHVLEWPRTGGMRAAIPQGGRYSLDLAKVHQVELSINGEGCKTGLSGPFARDWRRRRIFDLLPLTL